jgi:glucose-fructose oxidoreductase
MRSGRRQFIKSVAATAALSGTHCDDKGAARDGETPVTNDTAQANPTSPHAEASDVPASSGDTPSPTNGPIGASSEPVMESTRSRGSEAEETTSSPTEPSSGAQTPTLPRPSSPLGVALLGLGRYASERLAPALQLTQHCRLVGIVTGTPSKVADWQTRYAIEDKNVYTYDTMSELIDNPDIHVVYVVTPNHLHPTFVIAAARAKKHVWCEKPMAMTVEECQTMIDVCKENGVTLSIGYRLQHEPNTRTLIGYAETKPFGAITRVEALAGFNGFGAADAEVWRLKKAPGGGALFDMGVYCINAARYALGEEPTRVLSATQWTNRPELFTEVDEFTDFELEFPSGAVASCRTSFGERMDILEVTCEDGSYVLEPFQGYTGVSGSASDGTALNQTVENQQAKQMDDDALSILEGRPMLVPGEEGQRDVRVVEAIVEAVQSGAPVVIG